MLIDRAKDLKEAYDRLIKAQNEIMAYCNDDCKNCPISGKACDDGLFSYDERMTKIEPWADFVEAAYKKDEAEMIEEDRSVDAGRDEDWLWKF